MGFSQIKVIFKLLVIYWSNTIIHWLRIVLENIIYVRGI